MLVKSGNGSFSMVGGLVLSPPQHHSQRNTQTQSLSERFTQLLKRFL